MKCATKDCNRLVEAFGDVEFDSPSQYCIDCNDRFVDKYLERQS